MSIRPGGFLLVVALTTVLTGCASNSVNTAEENDWWKCAAAGAVAGAVGGARAGGEVALIGAIGGAAIGGVACAASDGPTEEAHDHHTEEHDK